MIIRVTINDNDYDEIMMHFMKVMWNFVEERDASIEDRLKICREHENIMQRINPNNDAPWTTLDKDIIKHFLKKRFHQFLTNWGYKDDEYSYLMNNFKVSFQKMFTDKWENGEAFYYLCQSRVIVNQ